MCGRVVQVTGPLQVAILCGLDVPDTRFANVPPRFNAPPSQELWAIRQNHDTGERSLDPLRWGLLLANAQAAAHQRQSRDGWVVSQFEFSS